MRCMNENLLCQYIYHRKLSQFLFIFRPLQLSPPMASCSTFLPTPLPNLRNYPNNLLRIRHFRPHRRLVIRAADTIPPPGSPRRLVDLIRLIPDLSRNYFKNRPRRALFGGISLLGGFYVAQTISLSFGALGVNDVIAAVLCVLLTEYATKFYYSQPKVTFPVALLNNFKMGFTYGLFIDAFKLAS